MIEKRPEKLTIELVLQNYEPLIRKTIRSCTVSAEEDDVFAEVLYAMIVPSKKWGTTYLQRYNPEIACASTYIVKLVFNHMRGVHRRESRGAGGINNSMVSLHTGEGNFSGLENIMPEEIGAGEDVGRRILCEGLMKRLHTKKNKEFYSRSSSGIRRSTFRMCLMMLKGDLDVVSIAQELEISPAEVRRRFKLLASDPHIRVLAEDFGWKRAC